MESGSWKLFLEEHNGKNMNCTVQYDILHLTERMIGFFYKSFVYKEFSILKRAKLFHM